MSQINEQRGSRLDRVSSYEAAISGKMIDVNVFKGVQQSKNKKSTEALLYKASAPK